MPKKENGTYDYGSFKFFRDLALTRSVSVSQLVIVPYKRDFLYWVSRKFYDRILFDPLDLEVPSIDIQYIMLAKALHISWGDFWKLPRELRDSTIRAIQAEQEEGNSVDDINSLL